MANSDIKLSNGNSVSLTFPNLKRIKELGELLGIDILAKGLGEDYSKTLPNVLFDEIKSIEVLSLCVDNCPSDILEFITPADFDLIVTTFFFKGKTGSVILPSEYKFLSDLSNPAIGLNHLKDTLSTSQSTMPVTEAQTE